MGEFPIVECHVPERGCHIGGMAHPSLENRPNPLYVKAMLLHAYIRVIVAELVALRQYDLADQLGRSVRSVNNNVNEAQAAQSRKDFVHKLKLASKELNEAAGMIATEASESLTMKRHQCLRLEISEEIAKIIGKSVATARKGY